MTSFPRQMAAVTAALALVALASCAQAGDYHTGSGLRCSDCHIMHASKDGTTYNGQDGFPGLLKTESVNALCLSCHGGADPTAPDVVATGTASTSPNDTLGINYASQYKNSSGYFQSDWDTTASSYGHNLGGGHVTAVQGTWSTATLAGHNAGMECTDCHNPHGGTNYRNLVTRPGTAGADIQVRGGVSGTQEVYLREAIQVPATTGDTTTHYDTDAVHFNDPNHISQWCMGCHTDIASTANKHPQDQSIGGADVDPAHWESGTGSGFGTTVDYVSTATERGIPRVRFATTGATDYASAGAATTAANNKVFCLTCHKAHGSRVDSGLVWPHFTTGPDRSAGCQQCHDKGT